MRSVRYCRQMLIEIELSQTAAKNSQISNFAQILPVGAALLNADRQADRHDEANSRFLKFCEHDFAEEPCLFLGGFVNSF